MVNPDWENAKYELGWQMTAPNPGWRGMGPIIPCSLEEPHIIVFDGRYVTETPDDTIRKYVPIRCDADGNRIERFIYI